MLDSKSYNAYCRAVVLVYIHVIRFNRPFLYFILWCTVGTGYETSGVLFVEWCSDSTKPL